MQEVGNDVKQDHVVIFYRTGRRVVILEADDLVVLECPCHHALVLIDAPLYRFHDLLGHPVILGRQEARERLKPRGQARVGDDVSDVVSQIT